MSMDYSVVLTDEHYKQLCEKASLTHIPHIQALCDALKQDMDGLWTGSINPTTFKLAIIDLSRYSRKQDLTIRLMELGEANDENFRTSIERLRQDVRRYDLFGEH